MFQNYIAIFRAIDITHHKRERLFVYGDVFQLANECQKNNLFIIGGDGVHYRGCVCMFGYMVYTRGILFLQLNAPQTHALQFDRGRRFNGERVNFSLLSRDAERLRIIGPFALCGAISSALECSAVVGVP